MAPSLSTAALGAAALCVPSTAFVGPAAAPSAGSSRTLREASGLSTSGIAVSSSAPSVSFGLGAGSAGACLAAAAAVALARRR
eukprot:CAMPEP_0115439850 /NCGR_PEP_ID=MMETSP0271-20121206/35988_1 /TAXON_ID=71861 /ORGANISM="Scrippsiella trochoidea, Strain CCMP3099" /LENGTH=82 /DNA_ID=CAMNT_0002865553 /DNA_START=54 /DNA_END=298 /DNA_ORIENTATION=-